MQLTSDCMILTPESASYVWIHPEIYADSKFKSRLSVDLCPTISIPCEFPTSCAPLLSSLLELLEKCLKHNFIASLLTLGALVQAFHYDTVVKRFGGCPITILRGEPETGKSKSLKA